MAINLGWVILRLVDDVDAGFCSQEHLCTAVKQNRRTEKSVDTDLLSTCDEFPTMLKPPMVAALDSGCCAHVEATERRRQDAREVVRRVVQRVEERMMGTATESETNEMAPQR